MSSIFYMNEQDDGISSTTTEISNGNKSFGDNCLMVKNIRNDNMEEKYLLTNDKFC